MCLEWLRGISFYLKEVLHHVEVVDVVGVQDHRDADPPSLFLLLHTRIRKHILPRMAQLEEHRAVHIPQKLHSHGFY